MDTKAIFKNKYYVVILSVFCALLWASAFPTLKICYNELNLKPEDYRSKIMFASMRFLLASTFIFIFIHIKGIKVNIDKKFIKNISILGLFQTSLQYFFFYNGLASTSGIKSSILSTAGIFFIVLMSPFVFKDDSMNFKKLFGLTLGLLGIIFVNWGKSFEFSFSLYGEGLLLLAGLSSAIGTFITKGLSKRYNTIVLTAYQMLFGASILFIIGIGSFIESPFHFTLKSIILLIYSAFLSATAFSIWNTLIAYNNASEIAVFKFLIPIFGTGLSYIFLNEKNININTFISLFMVSFAIIIINKNKKNEKIALQK